MTRFFGTGSLAFAEEQDGTEEGLPTWKCHEEPVQRIKSRRRYLDSIGARGFGYPTPSSGPVTSRPYGRLSVFLFSIPISLKSGENP